MLRKSKARFGQEIKSNGIEMLSGAGRRRDMVPYCRAKVRNGEVSFRIARE